MSAPIGIIGSGAIGSTLARLVVAAGFDVVIANSRGPESLAELVAELGPRAAASSVDGVARHAEIVITAIPLAALTTLPVDALAGRVIIDTTNYYPQRDGRIAVLDRDESTASELVQAHLERSSVVKGFNNITFASLGNGARPPGDPERSTLPIAGENGEAKQRAAQLIDALGYDTLDIGGLSGSWRSEPNMPIYCDPYMPAWPTEELDLPQLVGWLMAAPVIPMSQDRARELIDSAVRGPAGGRFPETA